MNKVHLTDNAVKNRHAVLVKKQARTCPFYSVCCVCRAPRSQTCPALSRRVQAKPERQVRVKKRKGGEGGDAVQTPPLQDAERHEKERPEKASGCVSPVPHAHWLPRLVAARCSGPPWSAQGKKAEGGEAPEAERTRGQGGAQQRSRSGCARLLPPSAHPPHGAAAVPVLEY